MNTIDWHGPSDISPAVQGASKPTVLFDSSGAGHAVYESMGLIYYSYQPAGGSWGAPSKIGTGISPTAVLDAKQLVHVAYRSEFLDQLRHYGRPDAARWQMDVPDRSCPD